MNTRKSIITGAMALGLLAGSAGIASAYTNSSQSDPASTDVATDTAEGIESNDAIRTQEANAQETGDENEAEDDETESESEGDEADGVEHDNEGEETGENGNGVADADDANEAPASSTSN